MKTEYLTLKTREGVWIPTYEPNGMPDGAMCFDAGKTYRLKILSGDRLDVSDYCMEELVVLARDVHASVVGRCFEVVGGSE